MVVIHAGRRLVRGDMGVDQPGLASFDSDVSLLQADLAGSHRLDLRALQRQARLEVVAEEGVAAGRAITGDDLDSSVLHGVSLAGSLRLGWRRKARRDCSIRQHSPRRPHYNPRVPLGRPCIVGRIVRTESGAAWRRPCAPATWAKHAVAVWNLPGSLGTDIFARGNRRPCLGEAPGMRGSKNANRTKSAGRSRKTSPAALPGEKTLAGLARSEGRSKPRARGARRRGGRSPLVPAPQSGELDALAEVGRHALRSDACLLRLETADGALTFVSGRSSADEAAVLAAFPGSASAPATSTKAVRLSIPILRVVHPPP